MVKKRKHGGTLIGVGCTIPGLPTNIYYDSTLRGITQRHTEKDTIYYGIILRWNQNANPLTGDDPQRLDELPNLLRKKLDHDSESVVPDGVMERFEIFDLESDDMIAMYRVPVQQKR